MSAPAPRRRAAEKPLTVSVELVQPTDMQRRRAEQVFAEVAEAARIHHLKRRQARRSTP